MIKTFAFRLMPGQDLKKELQAFADMHHIEAGWIVTCVGSLTQTNIRFANQNNGTLSKGYFEILSLSGTISKNGAHLHLCVAKTDGSASGGHLLDNNIIYTTAEVILQASDEMEFKKEKDPLTGWQELVIKYKS